MSSKIEVVDTKRLGGAGALLGFASVRLGAILIHGWRVVQQDGQAAWVSPPINEVVRNGEYYRVVEINSDKLEDEIARIVLEEFGLI